MNTGTGELFNGFPGIYERFVEDHNTPPHSWASLTNGQRLASFTDTGNLHWAGPNVSSALGVLSAGASGGNVDLFAPAALQPGNSISHWDTSLRSNITSSAGSEYHELMAPFATGNEMMLITDEMLEDQGWNAFEGDCGDPTTTAQDTVTLSNVTINADQEACVDLIISGNTDIPDSATVSLVAGRKIYIGPGFSVSGGAGGVTFSVDPLKSLRF